MWLGREMTERRVFKTDAEVREYLRQRDEWESRHPVRLACGFCGWTGSRGDLPIQVGPVLLVDEKTGEQQEALPPEAWVLSCPRCGRDRVSQTQDRWTRLGEALREAELTPDDVTQLHEYLRASEADPTVEKVIADNPAFAPVISVTINNFGSDKWLTILTFLVSALIALGVGYWAHTDAQKTAPTTRPADEAVRFSDQDITKITTEVKANLNAEQERDRSQSGKHRSQP